MTSPCVLVLVLRSVCALCFVYDRYIPFSIMYCLLLITGFSCVRFDRVRVAGNNSATKSFVVSAGVRFDRVRFALLNSASELFVVLAEVCRVCLHSS